jgi:hypothetical protein
MGRMETAAKKRNGWASSVFASMVVLVSALVFGSTARASSIDVASLKTRAEVSGPFSAKSVEHLDASRVNATRYYDQYGEAVLECTVAPVSTASRFSKTTTPWQRTVHQRSDIDWELVRPDGLTNLQAARRGYTPKRVNPETGKWDDITLHHLNDDPRGGVVEVWRSTHGRFHKTMSREPNPWRTERPDWAIAWDNEQSAYWRWRTGAYTPAPTLKLRLPGDQ